VVHPVSASFPSISIKKGGGLLFEPFFFRGPRGRGLLSTNEQGGWTFIRGVQSKVRGAQGRKWLLEKGVFKLNLKVRMKMKMKIFK